MKLYMYSSLFFCLDPSKSKIDYIWPQSSALGIQFGVSSIFLKMHLGLLLLKLNVVG